MRQRPSKATKPAPTSPASERWRFCSLDDITVRTNDGFGRRLGLNARVNLDEIVGANADGSPLTLEAALGDRVDAFVEHEVVAPVLPSPVLDNVDDGVEEGQ